MNRESEGLPVLRANKAQTEREVVERQSKKGIRPAAVMPTVEETRLAKAPLESTRPPWKLQDMYVDTAHSGQFTWYDARDSGMCLYLRLRPRAL